MQDDTGLKRILTLSRGYQLFKTVVGARTATFWIRDQFWRIKPGQKVVDIGCGPGSILEYLPDDIRYVGFDISTEYIQHARSLVAGDPNKQFIVGVAEDFITNLPEEMRDADLVIMNGLLHHLEDEEAITALRLAYSSLAPGGRLVCLEGCFLLRQEPLSRWMVSQDRGKNVRYEAAWKALIAKVFPCFETHVLTGLLRIPYTHLIVEARK